MGDETLDAVLQKEGDTKEGFYIGREVAADSEEAKQPLHGPNQWPNPVRLTCRSKRGLGGCWFRV